MTSNPLQTDLQYILDQTFTIFEKLNGKKILLTGGTGFFGKWLLESFLFAIENRSLDIKIYILSRNPEAFNIRFPHLYQNACFTFLKGDVTDFTFMDLEVDYIIHAATEASARLNHEQPVVMIDNIINGTRNVLEFARKRHIKRMLFISSGAVYGLQPEGLIGFPEDYAGSPDPLLPSSAYAEAKRAAELYCTCYSKQYQIEIPVARCFAFIGPYLDLDIHFAIGNFIRNGLEGENIIIKGDGKPLRSLLYTADLVIWLLHIFMHGRPSVAYNVGSDEAVSIKELAYKVAAFFPGLKVEVLNQTRPTDRNQNYIPDVSKMKREFELIQNIDLENAIRKTILFYQKEKKA
jgi:dTDP-glucose 4,6-dehydratase